MSASPVRFRDPRSGIYEFLDSILVRCPRCEGVARVLAVPGEGARAALVAPRRLICRSCGPARTRDKGWVAFCGSSQGPARDPYFGAPLWLQTETRHGWLWAYNLRHLDLIRRFVAADLRERAPWYDTGQKMTLLARLPAWIVSAKHRAEVLRALDRVRASVVTPG
ncbi:hypothetical protein [Streptomyces sp. NPDC018693]|uniref:hypothetical protein n=1 Tax=unclassified Streptomyces TaxID=2593676 RepID=UPI0037B56B30